MINSVDEIVASPESVTDPRAGIIVVRISRSPAVRPRDNQPLEWTGPAERSRSNPNRGRRRAGHSTSVRYPAYARPHEFEDRRPHPPGASAARRRRAARRELPEGAEGAGWTADTIERIIAQDPVVTISSIDEYGLPWFEYQLKSATGEIEEHSLAIMEDDSVVHGVAAAG